MGSPSGISISLSVANSQWLCKHPVEAGARRVAPRTPRQPGAIGVDPAATFEYQLRWEIEAGRRRRQLRHGSIGRDA